MNLCNQDKLAANEIGCGARVVNPIYSKVYFNNKTNEVWDEFDNYLGKGIWDEDGKILKIIPEQHFPTFKRKSLNDLETPD